MVRGLFLSLCILLGACAGPPAAPPNSALLRDTAFAAPSEPVSGDAVFALSPEMRQFLAGAQASTLRQTDPRRALVDMLYRKEKLALSYDAAKTRNAAEAFAARAGNCLSLVIMTSAFAKALGMPVRFQRVYGEDAWSRSGDMYFANSHVNLVLEWSPMLSPVRGLESPLIVDFQPAEALRGQRARTLSENAIVAMYMNNRAAEALVDGDITHAYWWARAAVLREPHYSSAYNTLGVIYQRHGLTADAERVFGHVLAREPDNASALSNQVQALRALGRAREADALAERLAQLEPFAPFHFFNAGLEAMRDGRYAVAREMFLRETRRDADYHEFQFWLALAELNLGNVREARRHLESARQSSPTLREQAIYAAKLDRLKAHPLH